LNLIEIGYFIFCVYYFDDYIITAGSSILVGYSLYSIFKFVPRIKEFIKKPFNILMEKTELYEKLINIVMISLEILFCIYILFKIIFINLKG
jgi:exosortase/archaeosortase